MPVNSLKYCNHLCCLCGKTVGITNSASWCCHGLELTVTFNSRGIYENNNKSRLAKIISKHPLIWLLWKPALLDCIKKSYSVAQQGHLFIEPVYWHEKYFLLFRFKKCYFVLMKYYIISFFRIIISFIRINISNKLISISFKRINILFKRNVSTKKTR